MAGPNDGVAVMGDSATTANVVGTGLIGGSIGLALRRAGWHVHGSDRVPARTEAALALGAIDEIGVAPDAAVTFVAVPVGAVVSAVRDALASTTGVVTDVGSVKGPIAAEIDDPRFVGGHPMAGSEQVGVEGARADLFDGAVWVLTPSATTDDRAFLLLRSLVSELGALAVAVDAPQHDALVAVVSHVPHLTAATLMRLATGRAADDRSVLRLAAGGFRDMTRIAAGHPGIWPDICSENREAIVGVLDELVGALGALREVVSTGDRDGLLTVLEEARHARVSLPGPLQHPGELAVVRVPIADRPGALAEVTTLASGLGVNIFDVEIAHSAEGDRGVLILVVEAAAAAGLQDALRARGLPSSAEPLE